MISGSRGTELARALEQWERRQQALCRSEDTLERLREGLARVREDVADARRELLTAAIMQGRAGAFRVAAPRDAKLHKSHLRQLAWLQAREAERERDVAVTLGCCEALREREAQAAERVAAARCGSVAAEAGAVMQRFLARGKPAADDGAPL